MSLAKFRKIIGGAKKPKPSAPPQNADPKENGDSNGPV